MHGILRILGSKLGLKNSPLLVWVYQSFLKIYYRSTFEKILAFRGSKFEVGKDISLFPAIYSGDFESKELDIILNHDFPLDAVIWDVGANIGIWGVLLAKHFPKSKIVCFEPQSGVLSKLHKNIELNGLTNIEVLKIGLGSTSEVLELATPTGRPGSSSLTLLSRKASYFSEFVRIETGDSILVTRPELLPAFIIIDIEGYEPRMITGCINLISKHRPILMLEVFPKIWSEDMCHEWKDCLNFLFSVYGKAFISTGNTTTSLLSIDFDNLRSDQKTYFFGL